MVDRLAQRLAAQGGSAEEWMRLVRTYKVLNEPAMRKKPTTRRASRFPADSTAQRNLAALARELSLDAH